MITTKKEGEREREREKGEKERRERNNLFYITCITYSTPTKSAHRRTDSRLLDSDTSLARGICCFQHKYRIVSRKITKYVSVPQIEESESIMESSQNFVQNAVSEFEEYRLDHILNTDQSDFHYLEHSSHT